MEVAAIYDVKNQKYIFLAKVRTSPSICQQNIVISIFSAEVSWEHYYGKDSICKITGDFLYFSYLFISYFLRIPSTNLYETENVKTSTNKPKIVCSSFIH